MPQIFPLNSYGNRSISVTLPDGTGYWIRTYYSEGQMNAWFFDIWDSQMQPLVKGIPIVVGSANLIAAYTDKFPAGMKIIAVLTDGTADSPDALGNGLDLVLYTADEESPFVIPDPMLKATSDDFQALNETGDHATLRNREIPNQHPLSAIGGLQEALADKASVADLEKKLDDAPADGYVYGRRNSGWVTVPASSGGGGSGLPDIFFIDGTSLILKSQVTAL